MQEVFTGNYIWNPFDTAFLKSVEWKDCYLRMTLLTQPRANSLSWPNFSEEFEEIYVEFRYVSKMELNLEVDINCLHQVMGIEIVDHSLDGWDNINFHIIDYENGTINFYCQSIYIIKVMSQPIYLTVPK